MALDVLFQSKFSFDLYRIQSDPDSDMKTARAKPLPIEDFSFVKLFWVQQMLLIRLQLPC